MSTAHAKGIVLLVTFSWTDLPGVCAGKRRIVEHQTSKRNTSMAFGIAGSGSKKTRESSPTRNVKLGPLLVSDRGQALPGFCSEAIVGKWHRA